MRLEVIAAALPCQDHDRELLLRMLLESDAQELEDLALVLGSQRVRAEDVCVRELEESRRRPHGLAGIPFEPAERAAELDDALSIRASHLTDGRAEPDRRRP